MKKQSYMLDDVWAERKGYILKKIARKNSKAREEYDYREQTIMNIMMEATKPVLKPEDEFALYIDMIPEEERTPFAKEFLRKYLSKLEKDREWLDCIINTNKQRLIQEKELRIDRNSNIDTSEIEREKKQ